MLIGYIRPHKRRLEAAQRTALEAAGVKRIWTEGRDETLADCIAQLRRRDVLAVTDLWLLAEPRSKDVRSPRKSLFEALGAIEERGATVVETASGRSSSEDRDAMLLDAIEWLSGQARGRKGAVNGRGKQPVKFAPEVIEAAERIWRDRRVKTWADAAKKLPKGFTVYRAHKMFGPRDAGD